MQGEPIGTRFIPSESQVESRKRWIISGLASRGEVIVDNGAAMALLRNGKSLLPAGITDVRWRFERGDTITIKDADGRKLACGVANYGAADMARIRGLRSSEIEPILGYEYGEEASPQQQHGAAVAPEQRARASHDRRQSASTTLPGSRQRLETKMTTTTSRCVQGARRPLRPSRRR